MAHERLAESDAVRAFWDRLSSDHTVMLGANVHDQHTQPMTALPEPANEQIWFFTRGDTDLAQDAAESTQARMVFVSKDGKLFSDVVGTLKTVRDENRIARYWNPMVAAWFPRGKDDPQVSMLCFEPSHGHIWLWETGSVGLIFELTKANLTHTLPKVGGSVDVNFRH